ncbi:hypothetical protein [Pseudodesulfovibrio sp.]|uniref:hypothetical protein n=1 Tax=unclassified Pseudodesulfovibrio TaxID=2661612 RepID=UPI003B0010ED
MRKFTIILLFLLHVLYLTSSYFIGRAGPFDGLAESVYFALAVFVYSVSFFELKRARYLLLLFYAHLGYRCIYTLPLALNNDAYLLFSGCLASLCIAIGLCGQIVFRRGRRLPQNRLVRLFLLVWLLTLTLISRMPVMLIYSVGLKSVSVFYAGMLAVMFISSALVSDGKDGLIAAQAASALVFVVPFLQMFPFGPHSIFSAYYVGGAMAGIGATVILGALVVVKNQRASVGQAIGR